jgi:hypothetical protein
MADLTKAYHALFAAFQLANEIFWLQFRSSNRFEVLNLVENKFPDLFEEWGLKMNQIKTFGQSIIANYG